MKALVNSLVQQKTPIEKGNFESSLKSKIHLSQNQPNPFSDDTIINYFIPNGIQKAYLQLTSLDGKILENIKINKPGEGQITFKAKGIAKGIYFFSLVLDGEVMITKQMVLTQ